MSCPDDNLLQLFTAGRLSPVEEETLEKHFEGCPACSERLEALERHPQDKLVRNYKAVQWNESVSQETQLTPEQELEEFLLPDRIGSYRIVRLLGRGGMGAVYHGIHQRLNRAAAVKVVKPSRSIKKSSIVRFDREMQAIGKLHHPNIVQAFDAGETEDGKPFLVMELLEGDDLSQYVKKHGPLSVVETSDVIRQASLGLQHVHEAGLVHRDIKPSNLWRTPDGTIKILDLGLARLFDMDTTELTEETRQASGEETQAGQILGSPDYMSPEQALDPKNVDFRSDLYALGCTLFYLLTGKPPFKEDVSLSLNSKIESHSNRELPSLKKYRNDVSKSLERLFSKLTSKRPEDRPESAKEIVNEINRVRPTESHHTRFFWPVIVSLSILLLSLIFIVQNRSFNRSSDVSPEQSAILPMEPRQIHSALINPAPTHHTVCMTLNIDENGEGFFGLERKQDTDEFETDFDGTPFPLTSFPKAMAFKGKNGMGRLFFDMRNADSKEVWNSSPWWNFDNVNFIGDPTVMQFKPVVEDGHAALNSLRNINFPCRISAVLRDDFLGAIGITLHLLMKTGEEGDINCYMHNGSWGGWGYGSAGYICVPRNGERRALISEARRNLAEPLIKSFTIPKDIIENMDSMTFTVGTNCPKVNMIQMNIETCFFPIPEFTVKKQGERIEVEAVESSESAYRAGLKQGDIIVSCNSENPDYEKMKKMLNDTVFGDEFDLVISRGDEEKEIKFYAE